MTLAVYQLWLLTPAVLLHCQLIFMALSEVDPQ